MRRLGVTILLVAAVVACSGDDDADAPVASGSTGPPEGSLVGATPAEQFPDIVGVEASFDDADGTWSFSVTVSSPYDTPERYADGWRVVGPAGEVYGIHVLAHDHANEQPFTRRQSGVEIPDDVEAVTIEGRDQVNGFGGGTMTVELSGGGG